MDNCFNFQLSENHLLSKLGIAEGNKTFLDLYTYIHHLPYGRNSNRTDLSLVITEQRGTCSSKHAFLKQVAIDHNFKDLSLWIGIYRMNGINTEGIHDVLKDYNLDFIPEAHCYLKLKGKRLDVTFPDSSDLKFENDLIDEIEISPNQVDQFKIKYHQAFLIDWIKNSGLNFEFEELWEIREKCISALQHKKT